MRKIFSAVDIGSSFIKIVVLFGNHKKQSFPPASASINSNEKQNGKPPLFRRSLSPEAFNVF